MLYQLADQVLPSKTPVKIWFFSDYRVADPKYTAVISARADLKPFADFYVREPAKVPNTYGAPLLRRFLQEARQHESKGTRVCFVLITDGGFTDLEKMKQLNLEIAQCPSVAGVWIGPVALQKDIQAGVEDAFSPFADQEKLVVSNALDMESGMKKFKAILRSSH